MGFTTWNKWCWFLTSFALKMCSKPWMFVFNLNLLVFGWVLHKCTLNMQHKAFNYAKWILIPFNFLSMLKIHFSHELCFYTMRILALLEDYSHFSTTFDGKETKIAKYSIFRCSRNKQGHKFPKFFAQRRFYWW